MIPENFMTVKREPDGGFVWLRIHTQRGSAWASTSTYPTLAAALAAALIVAVSRGLPLIAPGAEVQR